MAEEESEIEPGLYLRHSNYDLTNPPYSLPPEIIFVTEERVQGRETLRVIKRAPTIKETLSEKEIIRDFLRLDNLEPYSESKKGVLNWAKRKDIEEASKRVNATIEEIEKAQGERKPSTHLFMGPEQGDHGPFGKHPNLKDSGYVHPDKKY